MNWYKVVYTYEHHNQQIARQCIHNVDDKRSVTMHTILYGAYENTREPVEFASQKWRIKQMSFVWVAPTAHKQQHRSWPEPFPTEQRTEYPRRCPIGIGTRVFVPESWQPSPLQIASSDLSPQSCRATGIIVQRFARLLHIVLIVQSVYTATTHNHTHTTYTARGWNLHRVEHRKT